MLLTQSAVYVAYHVTSMLYFHWRCPLKMVILMLQEWHPAAKRLGRLCEETWAGDWRPASAAAAGSHCQARLHLPGCAASEGTLLF